MLKSKKKITFLIEKNEINDSTNLNQVFLGKKKDRPDKENDLNQTKGKKEDSLNSLKMPKYALDYLKKYNLLLKQKLLYKNDKYLFLNYFNKWIKQLDQKNNDSIKKGIIIYGPPCTGKTIFCRNLVDENKICPYDSKYIIYDRAYICRSSFQEKKATAKLIIMDDIELTNFNKKFIKGLLNNQIMPIIDKEDNWYIKLPVIIITNSIEKFLFYLNNDDFKNKCYILTCNSYIGPKGTQPKREIEGYNTSKIQLELDEFQKLIDI